MSKQSPIFAKTEAFMGWLFAHTGKFPKSERFRLAKRIEDALFDFHKCLTAAVYRPDTRSQLKNADLHLNLLRAYLRLALELKHSSPRQYHYAAKHIDEIGKLLGGWLKKA
ncbi:MAG TPA: diversity-generating retroelement protein Avd [Chloroflexi bacterium]|nr:diversity-generating retroelement protein Avd [Chloroflexota bacterium]